MAGIAQMPRVIEIDHQRPLAEESPFYRRRQPGQRLLFDPDQIVSSRRQNLPQPPPVGSQ